MPVGDDVSALTDWVELRVANESAGLPLARLDRLLKAEGSELADEELEADSESDGAGVDAHVPDAVEITLGAEAAAAAEVDVLVELIREEVEARAAIAGDVYPFRVDDTRFHRHPVCGSDVYMLLLVLGTAGLPYRRERRANEVEEAYDMIALEALKRFLGRDARGVRFARTGVSGETAPEEGGESPNLRPTSFPRAIEWLRDQLDVGPGVRAPTEDDPQAHWEDAGLEQPPSGRLPLVSYNDAGVDVVVWWRFRDERAGFPILLAQCTVQLDWGDKVHDVDIDMWRAWIDFHTVPPQKALVIPFADPRDHPLWMDRNTKAGVVVDRVRLIELLQELDCEVLDSLVSDATRAWTAAEVAAAA